MLKLTLRGGCCDACGDTGNNKPDEMLCVLCKLKGQAAAAIRKDWINQYHMIQGMIRDEVAALATARKETD